MAGARDYLKHLRLPEDLPPTVESLQAIQHAHLQQVPYNNLEIMLGRPPSVVGAEALDRLVATGRSGYCFHQNGVLETVLRELGFTVQQRHGHVWTQPEHQQQDELNHLVLLVSGLPTTENPAGLWWPDVGLGDGVWDPLPVAPGPVAHPPFAFAVSDVSPDAWSFRNDPRGSFAGVEVRQAPTGPAEVLAAHRQLSTPPHGAFTRLLVVARREPLALSALRGCVVTRIDDAGSEAHDLLTYDEWRDALQSLGLAVEDVDSASLHDLFDRMLQAHRVWDQDGRSGTQHGGVQ